MKRKQILCLVLALMMCVSMLAGCGDSGMEATNPPAGGGESAGNPSSGGFTPSLAEGGLQITADCVFPDPADLDFDACYPLYFGPTNEAVAMSADTGMQYYVILIYTKEETIKAMYTVYSFDTAEHASKNAEDMKATNNTDVLSVDGSDTVVYTVTDEATCAMLVGSIHSSGAMADTNASSFADYYVTYTGAELLK